MRLHRLAVTAFGPFAGSEDVDLDALASCGLFLIHGPTGAGKTSILDAICFALYAAVPGARAGARARLRSDHAAEGVIPEVTLEFTAAGRRLRVCRSPEFSRPKKRGVGDTTVPAKVVLEECTDGEWSCLGTRHDEVALVLRDVLGMGLEQFIKVVLLPQGDFAAFLRASPEERRSVLEKLFETRRFTDVETWLAERRRETATAVGTARQVLSTSLLRVEDVIARLDEGDDIIVPDWSDLPNVATVLDALATSVDLRANTALVEVEVARSLVVQTESAVHHGAAVVGHQQTAADAQARLFALDEQQGAYRDALLRVDLSERATAVSGFVAAVLSANLMREAGLAKITDLREPLRLTAFDTASVRSLIEKVAGHNDMLQQVVALAGQAHRLAEESTRHVQAAQVDDDESVALAGQREETEVRRAAAEESRDAGRAALADIPALEARHRSRIRTQQLLDDQERSAGVLETLQGQTDSADRLLLDARERHVDLRERRLAGMAAELAEGLDPGDPCPVCGSCVHPMPAMATDIVSPADIASAEAEQTRAAEALGLLRSGVSAELARRDARTQELDAHSGGLAAASVMSVTDARDALAASAVAIDDARATAATLPQAQAQLAALGLELEQLRGLVEKALAAKASSLALARSTRVQSQTAAAEVTKLLASHGEACPCHIGEPVEVTQAADEHAEAAEVLADHQAVISRHHQMLDHLRSLATGLRELVTLEANTADAVRRLSEALQTNGLDSLEQAQAGVLPRAEAGELTTFLRTAEQQRAQATALLAQPDVLAALTLATPDLDALAVSHRQASASLTEAGRRHTLSEQAQRELHELSCTVHQALADLGPAQQQARLTQELADCFAGNSADNALRMRLSSYVLATRLAEIATLANEHLSTMSDGRYTLEYTDARAAKGARSGLGLLVRDAWTGKPRETSSLSGGEAFMASLALALGLGDAVRGEAGGFDLQTLFVDEGFGSLDEDSLEQVMAVLDTLREGGRAVGIVSHVTELRQRIPQQLHVLKEQAGSTIHVDSGVTSVA
jgi:DNA repair protein SbcC/Rad50